MRCARRNLEPGRGTVLQGDLDQPLPPSLRGGVDVLVANAPYVPTAAIGWLPTEARLHEPRATLDGGADGLDVHRRIAAIAPSWLRRGGRLVVELSQVQAEIAVDEFAAHGLTSEVARAEELDATVVIARLLATRS